MRRCDYCHGAGTLKTFLNASSGFVEVIECDHCNGTGRKLTLTTGALLVLGFISGIGLFSMLIWAAYR